LFGAVADEVPPARAPALRLAVGNASGEWRHSVETNRLWVSNLAILGFSGGSYLPTHPESVRPAAEGALKAVSEARSSSNSSATAAATS
jgi:NADPH2:quinone reductase